MLEFFCNMQRNGICCDSCKLRKTGCNTIEVCNAAEQFSACDVDSAPCLAIQERTRHLNVK